MNITESTTRYELIARIRDLEAKIEELKRAPDQRKLREAANLMAELGRIHNTPHAKYQWILGN